jgi:putative glycosyltransferase (TIGR04348 family)
MRSPSVVIVSPALAAANNGNWQTARRWRQLLGPTHPVRIAAQWPDAGAARDTVMLALHARRSAGAVAAWADAHGSRGLGLVLTGTDLYRDIAHDPAAQRSLDLAHTLVVLQELGVAALPPRLQAKARVIFQSAPQRQALAKGTRTLSALAVGHLRAVKSPHTVFEVARMLAPDGGVVLTHIGDAVGEPALAQAAQATAGACPHYRWLGGLPHETTRRRIQRAHVLVHTSAMEGGAHVIMEAVRSGTPVLASRVPGNVGMLGADYAGYFPHGDAAALAGMLGECRADQLAGRGGLLARLREQCERRAPLFSAEAERAALLELVAGLAT